MEPENWWQYEFKMPHKEIKTKTLHVFCRCLDVLAWACVSLNSCTNFNVIAKGIDKPLNDWVCIINSQHRYSRRGLGFNFLKC